MSTRARNRRQAPAAEDTRSWTWQHTINMLVALAAICAVVVSHLSNQATQRELDMAQRNQHADIFDKAVQNLGNQDSADARLGGIYQLASLMNDAPDYRVRVMRQLASFIQSNASLGRCADATWSTPNDIQEALSVIGNNNRPPAKSSRKFSADLSSTCLRGADLVGMNFERTNLSRTNLSKAVLSGTSLAGAQAFGADLSGVVMISGNLTCAVLAAADMTGSMMVGVKFIGADMIAANLTDSILYESDMSDANTEGAILSEDQEKTLAKPLNAPQPYCFPPDQYGPIIPGVIGN